MATFAFVPADESNVNGDEAQWDDIDAIVELTLYYTETSNERFGSKQFMLLYLIFQIRNIP